MVLLVKNPFQDRLKLCRYLIYAGVICMYALMGNMRYSIGPIVWTPEQIILVVLLPILLLAQRPSLGNLGRSQRKIAWLLSGLFVWFALSNTLIQKPNYTNLNQIKNYILPLFCAYMLVAVFVRNRRDIYQLLGSILVGTLICLCRVLYQLDSYSNIVRPQYHKEFAELYKMSYLDLGVLSGISFIICIGWLSSKKSLFGWITNIILVVVFAVGMILSGSRAIIGGLVVFSLLTPFMHRLSRVKHSTVTNVMLISLIGISLFPRYIAVLLPEPRTYRAQGVEMLSLDYDVWLQGLHTRLQDWELMIQSDDSIAAKLVGRSYDKAVARAASLGHTHNIFVWMYIMGGMVAVILFSYMLTIFLGQLHTRVTRSNKEEIWIISVVNTCIFLLLAVLTTNCWCNSIATTLGLLAGIIHCMAGWTHQEGCYEDTFGATRVADLYT